MSTRAVDMEMVAYPRVVRMFGTLDELLGAEWVPPRAVAICDRNVLRHHPVLEAYLRDSARCLRTVEIEIAGAEGAEIEQIADDLRDVGAEAILSIGGGSTIDTAKGVTHLMVTPRRLAGGFESPGRFDTALPHWCVPTVAGPGAEASPAMVYRLGGRSAAIVDPRLVPESVFCVDDVIESMEIARIACGILDGISHAFESTTSLRASRLSRQYAASGGRMCVEALSGLLDGKPRSRIARQAFAGGAIAGQAIQITGASAVHAIAGPVSAACVLAHSASVGVCLSEVLRCEWSTSGSQGNVARIVESSWGAALEEIWSVVREAERRYVGAWVDGNAEQLGCVDEIVEASERDPRLRQYMGMGDALWLRGIVERVVARIDEEMGKI